MKYLGAIIALIILVLILVFAGRGGEDAREPEDNNEQVEGDVLTGSGMYMLDTEESEIEWEADKTLIADYTDEGTIEVESGTLTLEEGVIAGGEVVVDMTTITATSTSNTRNPIANLTDHLKSDDFFAVETYPTATFEVTSVAAGDGENVYDVTGDMTIKGHTESLTFPLVAVMEEEGVRIAGDVVIDRTPFDVRFGSDNFFENLGDNVISDEFRLSLDLLFTRDAADEPVAE